MSSGNSILEYPRTDILKGKVVAITGGLTGIGRAICLEAIRQGASVSVNYLEDSNSPAHIQSITSEISSVLPSSSPSSSSDNDNDVSKRFLAVPGDISQKSTSEELITLTVQKFGKLTTFVSNAGICQFADFLDITPELYERTVNVNLNGAFYGVQAAARQMKEQGEGGSIIGISSISALVGGAKQTHYTPTKAGVLSLMQSCATALGEYGIRCNAILPGTIRTQLNEDDLADDDKRKYMEGRTPLGRTGVPSDVAGPAIFLASDFSRYMSGAQILVDGGLFVNLQ